MQSILIIDTPKCCFDCRLFREGIVDTCFPIDRDIHDEEGGFDEGGNRPLWCPLSHPLKRVSNDFYIYDRKYLFDHLDREIDLLKGTKAFEEFMKAREEE